MLNSARKTMPALDYVSIVRSVYTDRRAMLAGSVASSLMAGLAAIKTGAPSLYAVTFALILTGILRQINVKAFWKANIGAEDSVTAEYWEHRAVLLGAIYALTYGIWCFVSMVVVKDPFSVLSSASLTIAVLVGICSRNFGLDRLVRIQMLLVIVPLALGFALHGDVYHVVLAALLFIMLSSFRKLASDTRSILLAAVHGRVEASRLAAELDIAITTLEHGLCMLDKNGIVSVSNAHAAQTFELLGVTPLANRPFSAVIAALSRGAQVPRTAIERLNDMVQRRTPGKVLLSAAFGRYYEVTISAKTDSCVLLIEDISERVEAEERMSVMARNDTLTELPNRHHFAELAGAELSLRAGSGQPSTLMIFDVDEFKHVNDSFGHIIGDQLLRQVAQRLSASLPRDTILGRLGGDEFIALSHHDSDVEQSCADIQRTIDAFQKPFVLDGLHLSIKLSIGVVTSPRSADELTELMTKADLALYAAKAAGKGRSQFFHEQMNLDYHYRQRLKNDLKDAIETNALSLVFQPLVDIRSRKIVTCEALARWHHPELGPIPPTTFIPMAEETGLISELTEWVIRSAAEQCATWPAEIGVAINVSARDLRGTNLPEVVSHALRTNKLPAERLEIEVTETVVIEERELAQTVLEELSDLGVSIALDDFGTGYSSLSYLHTLPFTKLKIDRAFVADIENSDRARRLLLNVARLGRDLDLTVVAEGVETEGQLNMLVDHTSVQQVQGYLFSRPLPPRDIAELIGHLNGAQKTARRKQSTKMVNTH